MASGSAYSTSGRLSSRWLMAATSPWAVGAANFMTNAPPDMGRWKVSETPAAALSRSSNCAVSAAARLAGAAASTKRTMI